MSETINLTREQVLTESRASLKTQSSEKQQDFWLKHNKQVMKYGRANIATPVKQVHKEIHKRYKPQRKQLDSIAKEHQLLIGGKGLQQEMFLFVRSKRHFPDPHLCALDNLNGNIDRIHIHNARHHSGLDIEDVRILAGKARGMSDRKAGDYAKTNKNRANRTWTKALKAIAGNQCWCRHHLCWMNGSIPFDLLEADDMDPKGLNDLIKMMRKHGGGSGGSDPLKWDKSGGSVAHRNAEMPCRKLWRVSSGGGLMVLPPNSEKGMLVSEHRLIFNRRSSRCIPPMHDIHHIDGNAMNNDWDNLLMLPRFVHRLICGNAGKGHKD